MFDIATVHLVIQFFVDLFFLNARLVRAGFSKQLAQGPKSALCHSRVTLRLFRNPLK